MRETRTDYNNLAREFGCLFRIGKYGIKLLPKTPRGVRSYRILSIIPLDGWITDEKEVVRIMRKRGMEL